jgi:FG-GAP-like repeat
MKTSSLVVAPVVCFLTILSFFGAVAVPPAQAQVSFFTPPTDAAGPIFVADFNGDGKPDILASDGTLNLGNGDGTFTTGTAVTGTPLAVADFNGDGKPDVLEQGTGTLLVLLGNGDGTFQPPISTNSGANLFSVIAGDVNGDGKADVLAHSKLSCPYRYHRCRFHGWYGQGILEFRHHHCRTNGIVQPRGEARWIIQRNGESELHNHACGHRAAPACTVPASVNVAQGTAAPVTAQISTTVAVTAGSISPANFTPGRTAIQWAMVLLGSGLLFAGYRGRKPAPGDSDDCRGVPCHGSMRRRFVDCNDYAGYARRDLHGPQSSPSREV